MNLAIVVGISRYDNLNELPACYNDAELIEEVLESSDRFDGILSLYDKQYLKSNDFKENIVKFIEEYKDKEVEELFLYYTGHGMYDGQEFYYLPSDYKKQKSKQTALENSELDTLLKSLRPNLTIKVVDACESGVQYIKGNKLTSKFDSYLEKTGDRFKSCYFMFSSYNNQNSWQNDNLSFFTKSFLNAIINYEGSDVRYKDIIDYISDEFETFDRQTPFFIGQADFTEKFLTKTEQVNEIVIPSDNHGVSEEETQGEIEEELTSLEELVKKDAEKYCTKEEVETIFNEIESVIKNFDYSKEMINLYNVDPSFNKTNSVFTDYNYNNIGRWLEDNKEQNYFAKPKYKEETYEDEERVKIDNPLLPASLASRYTTKTVTKTKQVVDGFKITEDVPYELVLIKTEPKFENIPWCICGITFIFSKTKINLFYFNSYYEEEGWDRRKLNKEFSWNFSTYKLKEKEEVINGIREILNEFQKYLINKIKKKIES